MNTITTHVLDISRGLPASGMVVELYVLGVAGRQLLATSLTNSDGRAGAMLPEGSPLQSGNYRLRFASGAYYADHGVEAFHPFVDVAFTIRESAGHYHLALLLSPHGYTTYRGS